MSASSSCATSAEFSATSAQAVFTVRDYDLAATLGCGQAFRWEFRDDRWVGVINTQWVELRQNGPQIVAQTAEPQCDWRWLEDYLQLHVELDAILATFPEDEPLRRAVAACHGLRLLRQPVWEALASFILSSTKQIVQIRQIISRLCERYGAPVSVPAGRPPAFAFPTATRLATVDECDLRGCGMGFRAPYLLATAKAVAAGQLNLGALAEIPLHDARTRLVALPGVGPKIADCVLLFACGFKTAFPVDVWVMKALRQSYFRNRRVTLARLRAFSTTHFGPNAGYAQQYLFHWLRMTEGKRLST